MPTVNVEMRSGRTSQQKSDLVRLLTGAVIEALSVSPETVIINITEIEPLEN